MSDWHRRCARDAARMILLSLGVIAALNSVQEGAAMSSPPLPASPPFVVRLSVPQKVAAGRPVPITIRLENTASEPVELSLGGDPVAFDVVVTKPNGVEVWNRLHGKDVSAVLQVRLVQPGEVLTFSDEWDQHDNSGKPVPSGTYDVRGILPVQPRGLTTDAVRLDITP